MRTTDQPQAWERDPPGPDPLEDWFLHLDRVVEFRRIELWIDPTPNAQLLMLRMLDWFGRRPDLLDRLHVDHAEVPIGRLGALAIRERAVVATPVDMRDITLAASAWRAFGQPSPDAWAELLATDTRRFPRLRAAVLTLLSELPDATGLGATQRRLLANVAAGIDQPLRLMADTLGMAGPDDVFGYWELGALLDGLAHTERPALLGLDEGPFDLALHDDRQRMRRWQESRLSLSDLGRALLAGADDWSRHVPIRHWWGGTLLTNDRLWRWDAGRQALVPPRH